MSGFEIFLIVAFSFTPIVALVLILLGRKRGKEKTEQKPETSTLNETKKEIKEQPVQEVNKKTINPFEDTAFNSDDFRSYLNNRVSKSSKPKRLDEVNSETFQYLPSKQYNAVHNQTKNINQQINELSPELKALIIAGILDRKDY